MRPSIPNFPSPSGRGQGEGQRHGSIHPRRRSSIVHPADRRVTATRLSTVWLSTVFAEFRYFFFARASCCPPFGCPPFSRNSGFSRDRGPFVHRLVVHRFRGIPVFCFSAWAFVAELTMEAAIPLPPPSPACRCGSWRGSCGTFGADARPGQFPREPLRRCGTRAARRERPHRRRRACPTRSVATRCLIARIITDAAALRPGICRAAVGGVRPAWRSRRGRGGRAVRSSCVGGGLPRIPHSWDSARDPRHLRSH
jgi:hypothetical protein